MRSAVLAVVLAVFCLFAFAQDYSAPELWQIARDQFDQRPARHILMVGNSRTSHNAMPDMLRHIADSAGDAQKYEVLLLAPNGSSFESLAGDWRVQRELGKPWDDAIFQGESRGQSSPEQLTSFMTGGAALLQSVHPASGRPLLIVNWAYDRSFYNSDDGRPYHYDQMQLAHSRLASQTGAGVINVGKLWEVLHASQADGVLTEDGNHPTVAASYFVALCLYANLAGANVTKVQWAPDGVPADLAATIRELVVQHRSGF